MTTPSLPPLLRARLLASATVALGVAASCTTTIESSTAYTGSASAQSLNLGGFAIEPGTYVYPQILTSLGTSARDPNATWQSIGAFLSSTSPVASGGRNYYSWNGTINGISSNYWPSGGVARMRVLFKNGSTWTPGVTFDDLGCFLDDPSRTYEEQALACAGHDSGYLHLVDGDPVRRSSRDYLSLRETPKLFFQGTLVDDPGADYYDVVDPLGARVTLADWQAVNGFSTTGAALPGYQPAVSTSYFNHGDLALGRHMNCTKKTSGGAIACYVTNYGDPAAASPGPGDSPTAALAATISRNPQGLVATVAMEYRPTDATNRVTFFAFDDTGARVTAVQLDDEGAKSLPGACIACHGGTFNTTSKTVSGAHFLPFDLDNFTYSTSNALYSRSAQEDAFRALNKLVKEAGPTPAITELVNGWYGSNLGTTGPDQDSDFLPAGWNGQDVMYREVIKPYCRGCHVALSDSGTVNFDSYTDLTSYSGSALQRVCELYDMPHAEVTRELFWKSPARGHLIGELSWPTSCN